MSYFMINHLSNLIRPPLFLLSNIANIMSVLGRALCHLLIVPLHLPCQDGLENPLLYKGIFNYLSRILSFILYTQLFYILAGAWRICQSLLSKMCS